MKGEVNRALRASGNVEAGAFFADFFDEG